MQLDMPAPTESEIPDTATDGTKEAQEQEEIFIEPKVLATAIQKTSSKDLSDEAALNMARSILYFFGFADRIIDRSLETEERDLFYMLEDQHILRREQEETTLYDGREWRIHYWILKTGTIHSFLEAPDAEARLLDPETNPVLPYYDPKSGADDAWREHKSHMMPPPAPRDAKTYIMLDGSEAQRSARSSEPSEIRRVLRLIETKTGTLPWEQIPVLMGGPPTVAWSAAEAAIKNGFLVINPKGQAIITKLGGAHLKEFAMGHARNASDSRGARLEDILRAVKHADAHNELHNELGEDALTVDAASALNKIRKQFFDGDVPQISRVELETVLGNSDKLPAVLTSLAKNQFVSTTANGDVILEYVGLRQYARSLSLKSVAYVCLRALKYITNGATDVAATPEEIGIKAGLRNPNMFSQILRYLSTRGMLKETTNGVARLYSIGDAAGFNSLLAKLEEKMPESLRGDGWLNTIKKLTVFRGAVVGEDGRIVRSVAKTAPRIRIRPAATLPEKPLHWQGKDYCLVDIGFFGVARLAEKVRSESAASGANKIPLPRLLFERAEAFAKHAHKRGTDFEKIARELNLPSNYVRKIVAKLIKWGMPFNIEPFSPEEHEFAKLLKEWGGEQKTVFYQKQPYVVVNVNAAKKVFSERSKIVKELSQGNKIPLPPSVFSSIDGLMARAHKNFLYYWPLQKETGLTHTALYQRAIVAVHAGIPIPTKKPTLEDLIEAKLIPWYKGEKTVRFAGVKYRLADVGDYDLEERAKIITAHTGLKKVLPISSTLFAHAEAIVKHAYDKFTDYEGLAAELGLSQQSVARTIIGLRKAGIPIPLEKPSTEELARLRGSWFGPEATFNYLDKTYTFIEAGKSLHHKRAKSILEATNGQKLPVNHTTFNALPTIFKYARENSTDIERICKETDLSQVRVWEIIRDLNSLGVPISKHKQSLEELAIESEARVRLNGKYYCLVCFDDKNFRMYAESARDRLGKNTIPLNRLQFERALIFMNHSTEHSLDFKAITQATGLQEKNIYAVIKALAGAGLPLPARKSADHAVADIGCSLDPVATFNYLGKAYAFVDAGLHVYKNRANTILEKTSGQLLPVNHDLFEALPAIFKYARKDGIDIERICNESKLLKTAIDFMIRKLKHLGVPILNRNKSLEELAVESEARVYLRGAYYQLVCIDSKNIETPMNDVRDKFGKNTIPLTRQQFERALIFVNYAHKNGLDFEAITKATGLNVQNIYSTVKRLVMSGLPILRNKLGIAVQTANTTKASHVPEEVAFVYDGKPYSVINIGHHNTLQRAEKARAAGKIPVVSATFNYLATFAAHSSGTYIDLEAIAEETGMTMSGVQQAALKINRALGTAIPTIRKHRDAARTSWGERPYALQILTETYRAVVVGDRGRCLPARRDEARRLGYVPITSREMCALAKAAAYINNGCFDIENIAKELGRPPSQVTEILRSCADAGVKTLEQYVSAAGQQTAVQ